MGLYFEGFDKARQEIFKMSEIQLLDYIDGMWGRDNLEPGFSLEQLRNEALSQCKKDFTDTSSDEYSQVEFYKKLYNFERSLK